MHTTIHSKNKNATALAANSDHILLPVHNSSLFVLYTSPCKLNTPTCSTTLKSPICTTSLHTYIITYT